MENKLAEPQRRIRNEKYASRAVKWLMVVSLICGVVLLTGIILAFADTENIGLPIGLILMGGLLGVIFLGCFLAEKSRTLIMDTDRVIFPRGAEINGKIVFQKTVVKICDIGSVERKVHKGDKIISDDCFFYTLRLKDGTSVTVTLYAYGKEAEKEIWETLKSCIA